MLMHAGKDGPASQPVSRPVGNLNKQLELIRSKDASHVLRKKHEKLFHARDGPQDVHLGVLLDAILRKAGRRHRSNSLHFHQEARHKTSPRYLSTADSAFLLTSWS